MGRLADTFGKEPLHNACLMIGRRGGTRAAMVYRYKDSHQEDKSEQQRHGIDKHALVTEFAYINEWIRIEIGFATAPKCH